MSEHCPYIFVLCLLHGQILIKLATSDYYTPERINTLTQFIDFLRWSRKFKYKWRLLTTKATARYFNWRHTWSCSQFNVKQDPYWSQAALKEMFYPFIYFLSGIWNDFYKNRKVKRFKSLLNTSVLTYFRNVTNVMAADPEFFVAPRRNWW